MQGMKLILYLSQLQIANRSVREVQSSSLYQCMSIKMSLTRFDDELVRKMYGDVIFTYEMASPMKLL